MLLSLFQISRIFAPNFWGWLADHTNKRVRWIKLTSFIGPLLVSTLTYISNSQRIGFSAAIILLLIGLLILLKVKKN